MSPSPALPLALLASLSAGDVPPRNSFAPEVAVEGRLRGEAAEVGEARGSSLTWRHRVRLESGPADLRLLGEVEHTWRLSDADAASAFPAPHGVAYPGGTRPLIADPDSLGLNRLQVACGDAAGPATLTLGRQAILWDDQRFVGAVGWRQNDQTFDAALLRLGQPAQTQLELAALGQVNRIYGFDTPAADLARWKGDSQLARLVHAPAPGHTLALVALNLRFDEAVRFDSRSLGLEWRGAGDERAGWKPAWILGYAVQSDAGAGPVGYQARYFRARGEVARAGWKLALGHELLGSDHGLEAFQFPLGTNHLYQGYADLFLTTPRDGLRDLHLVVETPADPLGLTHRLAYHRFATDFDSRELGWEVDWNLRLALGPRASLLLALAFYDGDGTQASTPTNTQVDNKRASLQFDYAF